MKTYSQITENLYVSDMGDEFTLLTNSQDINDVLFHLGYTVEDFEHSENQYGCLFVEVLNGEYGRIYGLYSCVPSLDKPVYPVRAKTLSA